MPPAVAAAGIAAAGAIGGAVIGSSSQKKAANQAADAQQGATEAQLQLGRESLALQEKMFNQGLGLNKDIYNANWGVLSPFASNGMVASNALNALLGLPAAPTLASPLAGSGAPAAGGGAPATGAPPVTGGGGGNWGGPGATPGPNPNAQPFGNPLLNQLLR